MKYANMGDLICDIRKAKSMTQNDLADKLHVTDKAVSKWERGVSCPDINTIPQLADILEISSDELLRFQRQNALPGSVNISTGQKINQVVDVVLKAVGMAMGIATLFLSIMGKLDSQTASTRKAFAAHHHALPHSVLWERSGGGGRATSKNTDRPLTIWIGATAIKENRHGVVSVKYLHFVACIG